MKFSVEINYDKEKRMWIFSIDNEESNDCFYVSTAISCSMTRFSSFISNLMDSEAYSKN
jgi:hypothetical protein